MVIRIGIYSRNGKIRCTTARKMVSYVLLEYFKQTRSNRDYINLKHVGPIFQNKQLHLSSRLGPFQDDCSTAGVFDSVLAALEVYPLPAEALEGVQTWTGCSQEGCHKTGLTAAKEGLAWVYTPTQRIHYSLNSAALCSLASLSPTTVLHKAVFWPLALSPG